MLRELVELIAAASETVGRGESVNHLQDCIDRAVGAVGKSDIEKRKMDEAICLLFRAIHEMQSDKDEAYDIGQARRNSTRLRAAYSGDDGLV